MIATYIQDLLATNNRVIVPNYGAFLVRATSKSKDANTLEEKLKDIYFSPFLKFNDELLEKHIIKKENITKEQAAQKITQFIEDIKKEIDQEKPYVIEGFGQFEADKQGKVQFLIATEKTEKTKPTEQAGGEKKKTEAKTTTKKAEPKAEVKPKAQETKKETVKKEEIKQEPKPVRPAGGKESKLEEFKPEKKEPVHPTGKESKAAPAAAQTKPIYSYKRKKKPINKGLVWSIAIGVPLAAIFIWALLNFETVKKVLNKEKVKTEKVVQKKKSTTKKPVAKAKTDQAKKEATKPATAEGKETTAKAETKPARPAGEKPEVKKPATPQKKYYIIAGSFKNEKYAISYLNKLQTEGYNAEKLAERNGMHAVSFNSFADKRKAIAEYKFLAQEKGLQAWILYY